MRKILAMCVAVHLGVLVGETADEAYARLSAYRSVWETNVWAYVNTVPLTRDKSAAEANGRWFADFLSFPDVTETNRMESIFFARERVFLQCADSPGILYNTNAWYALADYIARLKAASDPRWIDESYVVVTDHRDDGVAICANTNPLLNFASYKKEHFDEFRSRHADLGTYGDAINAFHAEWRKMIDVRQKREWTLESALRCAKQTMKEQFWLFGAEALPAEAKATCRFNIVQRAHLSAEEERDIFYNVPDWYIKVRGRKAKK